MNIQVGEQNVETDSAELHQRIGHPSHRSHIESVLLEQERKRQTNIIFVIDKKQTKALSRLAGTISVLGWAFLVFSQIGTLPTEIK